MRELESQLTEISHSIIAVLSLALQYGPVTVVTNAETGWVQLSAQKFIPLVVPMLAKLTIVSARSTYESMFPDSPLKWKYYCQSTSDCAPCVLPRVQLLRLTWC